MSIFKESFQSYVSKQLKIREEIVKGGNQHRFGNPKISFEYPTVSNVVKESVNLPPGAFYTYTTSKQCTIRMSSGVNLTNPNLLENYGFENSNDLLGAGLAIRYILEGGVPAKNIDFGEAQSKFIDGNVSQIKTIPRGKSTRGFARGYGSTYGDPFIRSDAQDGYGIVPMPGIIDANIRTKTAYGSIREAQVNFTCHNRRQLEILELLYMRPGFPVLLEWGWTPFINNAGELIKNFPYYRNWFSEDTDINTINNDILIQKINHSGNYDGFVGFIKNFEISARADGGYDCTTHLTAMGEVLEGIKGKRTGKTYEQEQEIVEVDDFEFYLKSIKEFSEAYSAKYGSSKFRKNLKESGLISDADILFPKKLELLESYQELAYLIDKKKSEFQPTQDELNNISKEESAERTGQMVDNPLVGDGMGIEYESRINTGNALTNEGGTYQDEIERIEKVLDPYIIRRGEELVLNGITEKDLNEETREDNFIGALANAFLGEKSTILKSQHVYIRWDFLVSILNNFIIPLYKEDKVKHPIFEVYQDRDLEYSTYKLKTKLDQNIDPSTNDATLENELRENLLTIDEFLDISSNPSICLLPHQTQKKEGNEGGMSANRKISNVFFNAEYLEKTYKKMLYDSEGGLKEDFGLYNFLDKIWKDVNQACAGTHNFTLQTDEPNHSNRVRVIDLIYQNNELNDPKKLHEVKIQGNQSIVRDFSFNTTIDNKFASTIAIAAQAPKSINTLDSITFEAFNKDIKYRFNNVEITPLSDNSIEQVRLITKAKDKYTRDLKKINDNINTIKKHRLNILQGTYEQSKISNNISRVRSLESKLIDLTSRYGYSNSDEGIYKGMPKNYKDAGLSDLSKSAVVPLKFGCIMDGISGIVIGNVFKVEKTKLPIGYQEDDIAFCVLSEDQKITAGQDWTTELSGQMILLDIKKVTPPANTTQSDTSETENPTDNAIKEEENKFPRRQIIVTNPNNQITIKSKYYDSETTDEFLINGIQEQILDDQKQAQQEQAQQEQAQFDETDPINLQFEEETYGDYTGNEEPVLIDDNGSKYYIIDTLERFHPEAYAEDLDTGWGYYLERRGFDKRIIIKDYPSFSVLYEGDYISDVTRLDGRSTEEVLVENARYILKQSLGMIQ